MGLTGWLIAATCVVLARAVWVRRWTFRAKTDDLKLTERPITLCLVLLLAGTVLMSPLSAASVGPLLHAVTGQWNLDGWIGGCLYMGAAGMIGLSVGSRLNISDDTLRAVFQRHFTLPFTVVVPVLLALLVMSSTTRGGQCSNLCEAHADAWLRAYMTLAFGFVAYQLAATAFGLYFLRRDPRNKRTATIYMLCCVCGVGACVLRTVLSWTGEDWSQWIWLGDCGISALGAYAASHSWRQKKVRWLEG